MKFLMFSAFLLLFFQSVWTQGRVISMSLEGSYPGDGTQILAKDFISSGTIKWGRFYPSGLGNLQLRKDFMKNLFKAIEDSKKDTLAINKVYKTLESVFLCDHKQDTLDITDPETRLFSISPFFAGNPKKQIIYGNLYATSSKEMANWLNYNKNQAISTQAPQGIYVRWVFLEKEAYVKGECPLENKTTNANQTIKTKTTYDLAFKEGWNAIVYEVDDINKKDIYDSNIERWTIKTTNFLPSKLRWFIVEN